MPLNLNDVVQVSFLNHGLGQQFLTVMHYRCYIPPTSGVTLEEALLAFATFLASGADDPTAHYTAVTPNNITLDGVRVQRVWPTRSIYQEVLAGRVGTHASPAVTPNVCGSIEKRTLTVGRKGVGRVQWPPLAADMFADGLLTEDFLTNDYGDFASVLPLGVIVPGTSGANFIPCLPASAGNSDYDLFDAIPQEEVRTMHRRTVGLGI